MPTGSVNGRGGWLQALAVYAQPRMLAMLLLGFSSGLPFYLVLQTLTAWLRQSHVALPLIGMFAWATIPYSLKFVWAPIVDRARLPLLHRLLGRRRAWMLLAQAGIAFGLARLAFSHPLSSVLRMALWALFTTFCAATQDIAMDAWRIESAPIEIQGAMAAAYSVGYRIALFAGSAGALALAQALGWRASYLCMAALTPVGIITTLIVREPVVAEPRESIVREKRVVAWLERRAHWPQFMKDAGAWFIGAVVCPLVDFFGRYGARLALLTLALVAAYWLTDFAMGAMVMPFYIDHGYTLDQIAMVVKLYGFGVSVAGVFIGGLLVAKYGLLRSLATGSALLLLAGIAYSLLAMTHSPTLLGLGCANALDQLALSVAGTSLIAFLSSLTSPKYTATQYALLSSLYQLSGKGLEGFSGFGSRLAGYPLYFLCAAGLSVPVLLLLAWLARRGMSDEGLPVLSTAGAGGGVSGAA
ncbi:MAG TPA: MFS transporter [Steroidobacteraceae bacterium]|nr:MFS transporter [Steroidobacteraceae bacterium]